MSEQKRYETRVPYICNNPTSILPIHKLLTAHHIQSFNKSEKVGIIHIQLQTDLIIIFSKTAPHRTHILHLPKRYAYAKLIWLIVFNLIITFLI